VRRKQCPLCSSANFALVGDADAKSVLVPHCVAAPPEDDVMAPYRIMACNECGVIFLHDYVLPAVLYETPHSDAVGAVWEAHFAAFGALIHRRYAARCADGASSRRLVEVGAGSGKLVRALRALDVDGVEVIDPQYLGDTAGVVVHPSFLDGAVAAVLAGSFDGLAASHTLEHAPDFGEFLGCVRRVLRGPGAQVFFSVPNQEAGFVRGDGTALCHEHSVMCTIAHWLAMFSAHGFALALAHVCAYLGGLASALHAQRAWARPAPLFFVPRIRDCARANSSGGHA
jgi:hypothetical protein